MRRRLSCALIGVLALASAACDDPAADPVPTPTETASQAATTVATVVAAIRADLDAAYAASEPSAGVEGPPRISCDGTGSVALGTVLACIGQPQTGPDLVLDPIGIVALVVHENGRAAWVSGTDVPDSEAGLRRHLDALPELDCSASTDGVDEPRRTYFWVMVRWSDAGRPAALDPDGNGRPCEDAFDPEAIETVLRGGSVD